MKDAVPLLHQLIGIGAAADGAVEGAHLGDIVTRWNLDLEQDGAAVQGGAFLDVDQAGWAGKGDG